MQLSLSLFSGRPWPDTLQLCKLLDNGNWHAVYISDHFIREPSHHKNGDVVECWTTLSAIAATTSNLKLGPLVSSTSMRHPAIIAKMAANINAISDGRLILGLGAGWDKTEHDAYGIPILDLEERIDMFEESLIIIKGLLKNDLFSYEGNYFNIKNASCTPNIKNNEIPIMVGSWKGNKKIINHAEKYADSLNVISPLHQLKLMDLREINIHKSVYIPLIYVDDYSKKILSKYKNSIPKDHYMIWKEGINLKNQFTGVDEVIIGDFSFISDFDDVVCYLDHLNNIFNSALN